MGRRGCGREHPGHSIFRNGIKAAHAAGSLPLAANLISTLGYHLTNTKKPREGLLAVRSALTGAKNASATTRALFHERIAWAYANTGQVRQAHQALAKVERDFARRDPDSDPEWVYWLDEDEIDTMAARCFVELGEPRRAIERLTGVVNRYDPRHIRELALYTSWLSQAHLRSGEIEQASYYANQVAHLAARTMSSRSDERVRVPVGDFQPFTEVGSVRELSISCTIFSSSMGNRSMPDGMYEQAHVFEGCLGL